MNYKVEFEHLERRHGLLWEEWKRLDFTKNQMENFIQRFSDFATQPFWSAYRQQAVFWETMAADAAEILRLATVERIKAGQGKVTKKRKRAKKKNAKRGVIKRFTYPKGQ